MTSTSNEQENDLHGKKLISVCIEFSHQGTALSRHNTTVDRYYDNVSPADGCDIIIGGFSTKKSRILSNCPDYIEKNTTISTWDGALKIKFNGYCEDSEERVKDIENRFREYVRPIVHDFCKKQLAIINSLKSSEYLLNS
jgi:hypothetical protein